MAAAREVLIRLVELLHDEDRRVRLAARVAVRKLRESATSEIRARLTELLGDKGIPTM
jgi:HEAT repeat protein